MWDDVSKPDLRVLHVINYSVRDKILSADGSNVSPARTDPCDELNELPII